VTPTLKEDSLLVHYT